MGGRYLKGTSLEMMEVQMRQVPGFTTRHFGIVREKRGCPKEAKKEEGREERPLPYKELVEGFLKELPPSKLFHRIQELQKKEVMKFKFRDGEHKKRFQKWQKESSHPLLYKDNGFGAAIYLFSADAFVWERAKEWIKEESISYEKICIHGVDLEGYALFCAAKEVLGGSTRLSLSELGDRELISDALFEVLLNGMLISRYGLTSVLKSKGLEKSPKQKKEEKGIARRE